MATSKKSENVPSALRERYEAIVRLTDDFSRKYLNDEYALFIRYAVAALCRKRPSPIAKGKAEIWAGGVTHALGMVNFLSDPSRKPHVSMADLCRGFGVSQSACQGKSKVVRDLLGMSRFAPEWTLPSRLGDNPMVWLLSVNGMIVDIRSMPRHVQEMAYQKGLIPYLPDTPADEG